ncbi:MAG: methyltransferase domain-containing protein [Nitrospinota bacterium]|nr:methyltransferase domain-containing protein [Nitrospinota bacterium]
MPEIGVVADVDLARLRAAVQNEYAVVANQPGKGFHFHTGRPLAKLLGYSDEWLEGIPESAAESLAGTGNPFSLGEIRQGERVVDIGCGAGMDSFLAAKFAGESGRVVGVDMTPTCWARPGQPLRRRTSGASSSRKPWRRSFRCRTAGPTW